MIINSLGQEPTETQMVKLNEGIVKINQATELDPKDIYFRNLSQAFLIQINYILNDQTIDKDQKQKLFQQAISNAELSATAAVKVNPKNSQNPMQLGSVYENFLLLNVTGAKDLAISNYQQAQKLNPYSPLIPFNLARVYLADKQTDKAKEEVQKSLELKADFQLAIDLLKQIETPVEE
jgi:tetratricopeptide (TPR) repeat protein